MTKSFTGTTGKPEIHGHRGARGLFPENSLVAIEAGIESGCDAIEVDLCVTSDNQLVIHHDPILSPYLVRDSHGRWISEEIRIRQLNLAQIKTFDIGRINPDSAYGKAFHSQQSIDGTTIPTLVEFVGLVKDIGSSIGFNLELKSTPYDSEAMPPVDSYVEIFVSALEKLDIVDRVFVQSFDWRLAIGAKEKIPELKIGLITDQQHDGNPVSPVPGKPEPWTNNMDIADFNNNLPVMIKAMGGNVWSSNHLDLNVEDVKLAHDLDLEVYVWTVNSRKDMNLMIDIGVDAITTDYPNRLFELVNTEGAVL